MDSGSGSLQSSSGGDEEYDSHHHHQQQPFLFPPPPPLFFNNNIPLPSSSFHYQNHLLPSFYDFPNSNFNFNPLHHNSSNSFLNLDPLTSSDQPHFKNPPDNPISNDGSTHIRSTPSSSAAALHPKVTTKKRTRASRRAPTTVLTTDTTNFRAMVQEFTGIPSPPFTSGGGSSYSRRFDLFGLVRTTNSTATSLEAGSGLGVVYPSSRSKMDNVVQQTAETRTTTGGIFSFQSVSGGHEFNSNSKEVMHLDHQTPNNHNIASSSHSQQLVSVLQNDETWRGNRSSSTITTTAATATATTGAAAAATNNAANCKSRNFVALGNIVCFKFQLPRGVKVQ